MRNPIIKIKRSTLGTSIVIRSLFARRWLFNITLAPKRETLEIETHINNVLAKSGMACTLVALVLLTLMGCENPTTPTVETLNWNSSYVSDTLETFPSCWYTGANGTDSLIVNKKHYTVSERSRYRIYSAPAYKWEIFQTWPVHLIDDGAYLDTKTDSIIVLNRCGMVWGK